MDVRAAGVTTPGTTEPSAAEAQKTQLARLSHEFEAMFLSEMLRGMRESMLDGEKEEGLGNETMTDTFDGELGLSLSKSGGLGLANLMLDALVRRGGDPATTTVPVAPHVFAAYASAATSGTAPASTAEAIRPATDSGRIEDGDIPPAKAGRDVGTPAAFAAGSVTSPFGWRADPFTGKPKFHAGTDLRMPYGQGVQAVAAGRVASVGERAGYGLTVVIDHGNGLETRYAHLSGADVREGDSVEAGQVVARSGNSGRSTGPHLHLEARQNGRAVEVASLLKVSGVVADSYADGSHVRSSHED